MVLGEEKCEKVQSYFGHFLRSVAKNERNRTWRGSSRRNPSNNGGSQLEAAGITDEKVQAVKIVSIRRMEGLCCSFFVSLSIGIFSESLVVGGSSSKLVRCISCWVS